MAAEQALTPTHIAASFRPASRDPLEGKLERVELDRDDAERGIAGHSCLSCGAGIPHGQCRIKFTQLPRALLGLMPLAVPMPVMFPVLLSALALGKKRTEVGLPLCSSCEEAHLGGKRLRRASELLCGGMAGSALPLILFTPANHAVVAMTWLSVMTLFLAGMLKVRKVTHGRVIGCELIADDKVVLMGNAHWRRALPAPSSTRSAGDTGVHQADRRSAGDTGVHQADRRSAGDTGVHQADRRSAGVGLGTDPQKTPAGSGDTPAGTAFFRTLLDQRR